MSKVKGKDKQSELKPEQLVKGLKELLNNQSFLMAMSKEPDIEDDVGPPPPPPPVEDTKTHKFDHTKRLPRKELVLNWLFPARTINRLLINMELRGGDHIYFFVDIRNKDSFIYQNSIYYVDEALKYWVSSAKTYCLDYHQDLIFPVRRRINPKIIKEATKSYVKAINEEDIIHAYNPMTFKTFKDKEVMEGLMRGQALNDFLKKLGAGLIAVVAVSILHFIIYLAQSGALQGLKFW